MKAQRKKPQNEQRQFKSAGNDEGTGERGKFYFNQETGVFERAKPEPPPLRLHKVITDTLETPIVSHVNGRAELFDSKSRYERHLKENGFRIKGDNSDPDFFTRMREQQEAEEKDRLEDTKAAYHDVKENRAEFTEQQKELHKREERECRKNKIRAKLKPIT